MLNKRFIAILFLLAMVFQPWKAGAQIYADVTVSGTALSGTSTFRISLDYLNAPVTVANFIGLATGTNGWIDPNTGGLRHDPYYNGLTFYSITKDVYSFTGQRSGGTLNGPGYTFRDENVGTGLLSHTTHYTVAMLNSGKDTNGSQWYITSGNLSAANAKFLNANYQIFGHVISGTSVCDAINAIPVIFGTIPSSTVTIDSITFSGTSYSAFNLIRPQIPKFFNANPVMNVSGTNYFLSYDHKPYSAYIGSHSAQLRSWASFYNEYFNSTTTADLDVTLATGTNTSRHFYRLARVDYSTSRNPVVPENLNGRTLTFTDPLKGSVTVAASGTTGSWLFVGGTSCPLTSYSYKPNPYDGNLDIKFNDVGGPYSFALNHLYFTSGTTGTYSGSTTTAGFSSVSGTFTATAPTQ
ncbi:MAG: peptidylprolyl isomerase [Verrucomicrobiota bacterium]